MRTLLGKAALGNAAWTLSRIYYSGRAASVNNEMAVSEGPVDIDFKSDGTKLYVLTGDKIYQYSLSTAWDVSTAAYDSVSFDVAEDDNSVGFAFKSDGTKMYIVGANNKTVYQYSLTAWDLSTAAYDTVSIDVSGEISNPRSITFKTDGTKMYIGGFTPSGAFQYSLDAWDLSTAAYDSVTAGSSVIQGGGATGIAFKSDGLRMFTHGANTKFVYQYTLSTAWNIGTASYDSVRFYVGTQANADARMKFKSDGTVMYRASGSAPSNSYVHQYAL